MNRFILALENDNKSHIPPVWLMRQAGRYMKSYQTLRKKYSFEMLCKEPELIYQVTKQPVATFGFDAAIIFSDILFIAELFGKQVRFDEQAGPVITPAITEPNDIAQSAVKSIHDTLGFVCSGISIWKKEEKTPLIGFAGGPFTVACYMIEGKSGQNFQKTKKFYYNHQESFFHLLDLITDQTIAYLNAQIDAGIDALQLFDSWASLLPWDHYDLYAKRWLTRLFHGLKPCPRIYFSRGSSALYDLISQLPIQAISLDYQCDLKKVRRSTSCSLQGNLDPEVLLADEETVRREVQRLVAEMRGDPGYIFNLGHGVLKDTPEKNIHVLVDTVRHASDT